MLRKLFSYGAVAVVITLARPQVPTVVAGVIIASLGVATRIWACGHLRKNREVTRSGPFAHLQHPLYLGTFLIALGGLVAAGSPRMPGLLVWAVGAPVFLLAFFGYYLPRKVCTESSRMERRFGQEYSEWTRTVPVFIPSLHGDRGKDGHRWSWAVYMRNHEIGIDLLVTALFGAVIFLH